MKYINKIIIIILCLLFSGIYVMAEENSDKLDQLEIIEHDLIEGNMKSYAIDEGKPVNFRYKLPYVGQDSVQPLSAIFNGKVVSDTTKKPFRFIGKMSLQLNGKTGSYEGGTAFLVSESVAVTAAHCIYKFGTDIKSITFAPGRNGSLKPYGTAVVTKVYFPKAFLEYKDHKDYSCIKYDYAVLELNKPIGKKTGFFSLTFAPDLSNGNVPGTLSGYPIGMGAKLYTGSGLFSYIQNNNYAIKYNFYGKSGQSGSPLYIKSSSNVYAPFGINYGIDEIQGLGRDIWQPGPIKLISKAINNTNK